MSNLQPSIRSPAGFHFKLSTSFPKLLNPISLHTHTHTHTYIYISPYLLIYLPTLLKNPYTYIQLQCILHTAPIPPMQQMKWNNHLNTGVSFWLTPISKFFIMKLFRVSPPHVVDIYTILAFATVHDARNKDLHLKIIRNKLIYTQT